MYSHLKTKKLSFVTTINTFQIPGRFTYLGDWFGYESVRTIEALLYMVFRTMRYRDANKKNIIIKNGIKTI